MSTRYTYAWPYKTAEAAADALDDMLAEAEVSMAERPRIEPYRVTQLDTGRAVTRYRITMEG